MMQYTMDYQSPLGKLLLAADDSGLTGLWFDGEKYYADSLDKEHEAKETSILTEAARWLDIYFSGRDPGFMPPLHTEGSAFQEEVWEILLGIPYGQTVTYGEIASQIAEKRGMARMSAQAVGGAVGHNEISIIIPCHRVVGTDGSLTGYAAGLKKKIFLLKLENGFADEFFLPKHSTAP